MRWKLARRFRALNSLGEDDFTKRLELFGSYRSTSQQFHASISHCDDCRFNPVQGWSGVDNERSSSIEFIEDMLRGRRADPAKSIGARRSHRPSKCLNDLRKHGMRANSNRDRVQTGGHNVRNKFTLR